MPNQITQYDNGTFEGSQAAWNEEYGAGISAAVQDNTEFFEGTSSVKMTTKAIATYNSLITCRLTNVAQSWKVTARIKCSAGFPNDAIFFISPVVDTTQDPIGFVVPVRASACKDGFIELTAYFWSVMMFGNPYFQIWVIADSEEYAESLVGDDINAYFENVKNFTASTAIPAGQFVWVDAFYADAAVIPKIQSLQFSGRKLYHVRNVFYLQVGGSRIVVDEPIKWDDVSIQIIFDEKTKAYRFEFSDRDVLLEFDNRAGRAILREQYKLKGTNADVRLLFGEYDPIADELTILYEGSVNFEDCEDGEITFKCNIERQSFSEKLRTYFDTRVNLFAPVSLGGFARPALALKELYLHPRLLSFEGGFKYNTNVDTMQSLAVQQIPPLPDVGKTYVSIPPFKKISSNVDGLQEPSAPDGLLIYAGLNLPDGISKRRIYISVSMGYKFTKTGSVQNPIAGFGIVKLTNISTGGISSGEGFFFKDLPNGPTVLQYAEIKSAVPGTYEIFGNTAGFLDLGPDEAIFLRATIRNPTTGGPDAVYSDFQYTNIDQWELIVEDQSVFSPSLIKAPLLFDAVNRQLELIIDKANVLRSDFLFDGCASEHLTANGLMVRDLPGRPFNWSAKDWFNSLDGLFCMGMSVERDFNENEFVRFEPIQYFFRNTLLINLLVVSDYVKSPASKFLFNELEFRFKKYPQDNQQDSLEDFHTEMNYVTPLKKIKNKLSISIDAILSGYYWEYTRREGFKVNPTNAYETDNDTFYLSARKVPQYPGATITYNAATDQITILGIIPLVEGDNFGISLTSAPLYDGLFTVVSVEIPFSYDKTVVTVAENIIATGTSSGTVDVSANRYEAKRDEDFSAISGVSFPKSVYNLEHHLKRIVLRWAKVFQSGWTFILGGPFSFTGIRFTEGKNNTEVYTTLNDDLACKYGDSLNTGRKDGAFEAAQNMDKPIFDKDEITFNAPLTWTAFNFMRTAFEGRNSESRDYGFIQFKNPDGETERGFVFSMKFNPNDQICKFRLIKKYDG